MRNLGTIAGAVAFVAAMGFAGAAQAQLLFDEDVTSNVIFGTGNDNGGFTVSNSGTGIEIGLRTHLRLGTPENEFNSNGDGTYSWSATNPGAGDPTTDPLDTRWNYDWSVNTDTGLSTGVKVNDLTYELGLDSDPTSGTDYRKFDPINGPNGIYGVCWDHSMGDSTTGSGAGVEATSCPNYLTLIDTKSLIQQSWKPKWHFTTMDGSIDGNYRIYLLARNIGGTVVARSDIQVLVGDADALTAYTCNDNSGLFDAPMDKAVMVKKKNQTLPLKMICVDAGGNVLGDGDILPPFVQVTLTEGTADEDSVTETEEILFTGKGTDGNEFVFDPDTGLWQFNLKTKNFTAAGLYEVTAGVTFGIAPTAAFTIK